MKLSITGYELTKTGNWYHVYAINPTPITNGAGYRPFYVNRNTKTDIGLWIPATMYKFTADTVNKMLNFEFGPSGKVIKVEVVK